MISDNFQSSPLFNQIVDNILENIDLKLGPADLADLRAVLVGARNQLISIERELANLSIKTEEIKRANKNFLKLYNSAPVGYLSIDIEGKIISINITGASLLGKLQINLIGDNFFSFLSNDEHELLSEKIRNAAITGESFKQDLTIIRPNGSMMHAALEGEVASSHDGFFNIVISDITIRKISEMALRRSEGWFRATIDAVSEILVVVDPSLRILLCNEAFRRQMARIKKFSEPVGENIIDFCPFLGERERNEFQWVFETGKAVNSRIDFKSDMFDLFLETRLIPIFDNQGKVVQTLGVMTNITDKVIATNASEEKEVYLKGIIENANDIIFSFNLDGSITYISPAFSRILGRNTKEILGKNLSTNLHADDIDELEKATRLLLMDHEPIRNLKIRFRNKSNEWYWFLVSMSIVENKEGNIIYGVGVATDINALIKYQEALEESRLSYKELWESQGEGAAFLDPNEVFIHVNPFGEKIFGLDRGILKGRSLLEFVDNQDLITLRNETKKRKKGESSNYELKIKLPDDSIRIISITAAPKFDDVDGTYLGTFAIFRDITSKKELENNLRNSEERHRQLFENNAAVQLIISANDGSIIDANPAASKFYGYSREKLRSMNMTDLNGLTTDHVKEFIRQRLEEEKYIFHLKHKLASGELRDVEVKTSPVKINDDLLIHSFITDITQQRLSGEKSAHLERMLIHSQRMEVFGNIAKSLTTEFSTILSEIGEKTGILRKGGHLPADSAEIDSLIEKGQKLINHILMFGSNLPFELQKWDLIPFIERMQPIIGMILGANYELSFQLKGGGSVFLDPILMEQVIVNIITNSRDSMPRGGAVTVSTDTATLIEPSPALGLSSGRYSVITIHDQGMGVEKEMEKHIFEPFLTTRRIKSSATGLSLITVHGIMKQHLGAIELINEFGVGTMVRLYLPMVDGAEISSCDDSLLNKTVLIVDDEEGIRAVTRKILEMEGLRVIESPSGEDALKFIEIHHPEIDLAIIDMILPGMTGNIFSQSLAELYPATLMLFISGYPESLVARLGIDEHKVNFLSKPFSVKQFRDKVRSILCI